MFIPILLSMLIPDQIKARYPCHCQCHSQISTAFVNPVNCDCTHHTRCCATYVYYYDPSICTKIYQAVSSLMTPRFTSPVFPYKHTIRSVLISPQPDQEGYKLQRQKILIFIYPIYNNHNWRNISTIYIYNKNSIKRNILTIKQNTSGSRSG